MGLTTRAAKPNNLLEAAEAGRALADAGCADLRDAGCVDVWLWVLEANVRARRFYAAYGFADTGDRTYSSLNNLPEIRLAARL